MKRKLFALFVVMGILALTTIALAQEYDYFVYLPLVLRLPPLPSAVYVLPNHSYYTYPDGMWVVGEIQNDSPYYLTSMEVLVNLFDSEGHRVEIGGTYFFLHNLPPGEKTCFEVYFDPWTASWSYYRFGAITYQTDGHPLPNITLLDLGGFYYPTEDEYKILGQVRNDHGTEVRYVHPVGTLYDAVGTVIGCDHAYPTDPHLNPGQISSFQIRFDRRGYADVTSYRVQVDGNPQ